MTKRVAQRNVSFDEWRKTYHRPRMTILRNLHAFGEVYCAKIKMREKDGRENLRIWRMASNRSYTHILTHAYTHTFIYIHYGTV